MSKTSHYTVIVSDRAKQMLGTHIRFIAQVSKEAANNTKKLLIEIKLKMRPYILIMS